MLVEQVALVATCLKAHGTRIKKQFWVVAEAVQEPADLPEDCPGPG